MAGPTPSITSAIPTPLDTSRVLVVLRGGKAPDTELGTADKARRHAKLTAAERAAIDVLVQAVALLRERVGLNGLNDAGQAVRLLLRDRDATSGGPWATNGAMAVGTKNALARGDGASGRAGVLLTVDSAIHELVHAVQFGMMQGAAKPHGAILEGIADAAAMLATDDDTLGEEFFRTGPDGRPMSAIRELGAPRISGAPLGPTIRRYRDAIKKGAEVHAAGGVVSQTFIHLRAQLGRDTAEALLWRVIRDRSIWKTGGSWTSLAQGLQRAAAAMGGAAPAAAAVALRTTGLDEALPTAAPRAA